MTPWQSILIYLSIATALFSAGWKVESWRWDASLARSAEHAINEVKTQETISTEATNEYAKESTAIDAVYDSVQPANNLPPIPAAASTARPVQRPKSRVYGLTYQQCDVEQAKASAMWNWALAQAKVH
jgi:hypothetical protein